MTTKERAYLRSLAMTLKPIFQIGKNGISENQVIDISNALEAHELIKINALKNSDEDIMEIANIIYTKDNSEYYDNLFIIECNRKLYDEEIGYYKLVLTE